MNFHETALDNGLNVVAELNPHVHSVAVGFFVRAGSRDETAEVSGVSHFLEHMAFKGNERYTADDVNRIFDEIGAKYNAQTSEEVTLFYAAILPEYFPQTFELLTAILSPSLRQEDFDMEKKVILEEIGMYEDQPSFTAYEKSMQLHFKGHPLGQSILGTAESIQALTAEQMRQYHRDNYKARQHHSGRGRQYRVGPGAGFGGVALRELECRHRRTPCCRSAAGRRNQCSCPRKQRAGTYHAIEPCAGCRQRAALFR